MPPRPPHRLTSLLLALLALAAAARAGRAESVRLTVLHTTDLHGALTSYDYLADQASPRGLVRIASMVKAVRAEGHPVLLLDDGDALQGGALETFYWQGDRSRPEPMMTAMTRLGYDAMAVGNHEFSYGPEGLARARAAAGFPWLAANVVRAGDGAPAFGTSLVKTVGGVKVGVVGLVTPAVPALEDSANWAGLRFLSPVDAAASEVKRLREREHCDVVVILAHTGLEQDPLTGRPVGGYAPDENWGWRIAARTPGADVVILGHTHVVVPSARVEGTLVTQAGRWGQDLGRVDLELSRGGARDPWQVVARTASVVAVADSVPVDSALAAFAAPYHEAAQAALAQVVGQAAADVGSPRGRDGDGPLWDLVQRAQLEATGADVSLSALFDPAAVIRRGPVTVRDAMRVYPYDNTLGVVELTGDQLRQALERSARYWDAYTWEAGKPLASGAVPGFNCDAAQGVSYEVDLTRPPGQRIINLFWHGQPLAPDQRLRVAVNSYRMNGGGGFDEIARAPRLRAHGPDVRQAVLDLVRKPGALDGRSDHNWTLLPDVAGSPERPLVDLLVRRGVAPREEALRLFPDEPARRSDLAYWLARSFGWREKRLSGAFADVPDSLEPWLDGLLKRRVLGDEATRQLIQPFGVASLGNALDWCEAAARASGYALDSEAERASFRRGLFAGTSLVGPDGELPARRDTLTRAQVLGLVANTRYPALRLLETTDFHGAILPVAKERRSGRALGGSAVLSAHIARLRAANPEGTILLDGGDCFQGTMISNLQYGAPVVEQMNALHYSAMAVGNHDFDWTADTLQRRVEEMHFAALGANCVERRTGRLPGWMRGDTLFTRRGVRVGVLGLCYVGTPFVTLASNVAHLRFEDDSATAARLVPELRRRGKAQVVVEVGHIPAESDSARHAVGGDLRRLALGVPGVDAWFGGHSHNQVLDELGGVPVVIAGAQGQVVGVVDLVVDPVQGRVVEHHARLVTTYADAVTPDPEMAARVERWNARVAPIAAEPIARNLRALTRNRNAESGLGDFVTDAMRAEAHTDVAFQNAGGLRADLPEGPVTRGSVFEVMPFDNTLVKLTLTGAELRRIVEDGLRGRGVPIQSGLRIRYDPARPEGARLVSLTLADGTALDDAKRYGVAVNNFMSTGGDNLTAFQRATDKLDTGTLIRESIERYISVRARAGVLDYATDGRVERVVGEGH